MLGIKIPNKFQHNNPFTIGVEEEYMLCHPETGELINKADDIIKEITSEVKDRYSYELILSEIEINTSICSNVKEAMEEIILLRNMTRILGEKLEYKIVGKDEADIKKNLIYFKSPIGKGLIGKNLNNIVEIQTPAGKKIYEVKNVKYI